MTVIAQNSKTILTRSEARIYSLLRSWAGSTDPLRFTWQVLNSRLATDDQEPALWHIPSANEEGKFYLVDAESRLCTCDGFHFRYHCSHIRVADRAALLRYRLLNPIDSDNVAQITHTSAPDKLNLLNKEIRRMKRLFLTLILLTLMIATSFRVSADSSERTAGTGANDNSVGAVAWSNPGNVTVDDGAVATCTFAGAGVEQSNRLKATNFGFSISSAATVIGIG